MNQEIEICNHSRSVKKGQEIRSGLVHQRYKCRDCGFNFYEPVENNSVYESRSECRKTKRFVITACQNNTQIRVDFLKSLDNYCIRNEASLLIVPILYRQNEYDHVTYNIPNTINHEIVTKKVRIHDEVYVMGSFNFIPTAVNPLSGLESLSKGDTLIVPSPQLRMKSSAVSPTRHPAILHTTGAISYPEYTNTKVGEKAKFNHSFSAVLVEIDSDNDFHIRALVADKNGSFVDLGYEYSSDSSTPTFVGAEALVTGDEHAIFTSPEVEAATYSDPFSIVKTLEPRYVVRHDVLDMYSGSHHHRNNSIKTVGKHTFGIDKVEDELKITVDYIKRTNDCGEFETIIVPSNHNDHLTKWLAEVDIKREPWNALFYHKLMYQVLSTLEKTDSGVSHADPFELYCNWNLLERTTFLKPGEGFNIVGVEVGSHGHEGRNGSRGSINQYADMSDKYVIGHSHTPGIISGAYQVGTSSRLKLEYTNGPSSWLNTHCAIYPNGKRQLITIINGKWKA